MANNIICVGCLVWPVPITYLNFYYLPEFYNVLAGQIIGWFAWSYSPTTQILLAGNRVMAVYFPQSYHAKYKYSPNRKTAKVSSVQSLNRQRRNRRMLFQSVCQDLIIAVDTFNTTYAWSFYPALWFQFLVCSYSRILARTLEGLVMILINESIREAIQTKVFMKTKQTNISETPATSTLASYSKNIVASNRLFSVRINH
ncbi:hypothetical protein GCK72_006027 [Caenorhabditis remanei]|uniref:7TM GPCR serpentine receptor class x (Srx) domain-containing protein n=1 Tax=Caenorhabditis remanei TaxID=31234 RepID=A0A6A5HG94_CAERE|nr:hypothetical protein GCK72_006027 [Caenorhabditis remanei]KAF1766071.1 hypothetical protein GCK72_006027 [Caenorhabditis remanei]